MSTMKALFVTAGLLGLTACGGGGGGGNGAPAGFTIPTDYAAVIQTSITGASDIEIVDMEATNWVAVSGNAPSAQTDYDVASYENYFYQIGRSGIDTLTKWDTKNPGVVEWQYSTKASGAASVNPHRLVFKDADSGYVIRYGSNTSWVVNLNAKDDSEFKTGELDFSAYDDGDGIPEATNGVVVGDRLYVLMQRIDRNDSWEPRDVSFIAVFDTNTNQEIDLNIDATLGGIPLQTRNGSDLAYVPGLGLVVQSTGSWSTRDYTGIEVVNLTDYSTTVLIDKSDGYNNIKSVAVVSETVAYFVSYAAWKDTTVYRINLTNGSVRPDPVAGLSNVDVRSMVVDPNGLLWVGVSDDSNPRIVVVDPYNDEAVDEISLLMNPIGITFTATK